MTTPLLGLTWSHPRGTAPLETVDRLDRSGAAGALSPRIDWSEQPLEGFESTPIDALADDYDVIVMDHPHVADAVAAKALIPLDDIVEPATLAAWRTRTVGPSFDSYSHRGKTWAAPTDAATQVSVYQPGVPILDTWDEVADFARTERIILCLAGPHAFLTWTSILVARGAEVATSRELVDGDLGIETLEWFVKLARSARAHDPGLNPIGILDRMANDQSIRLCPLVYQYVSHANRLEFRDAPAWTAGGRRGSVLGGAGMAVTRRGARRIEALLPHIERMLDDETQREQVAKVGGQPSSESAWASPSLNETTRDFYRGTHATITDAWVRPRLLGWSAAQDAAGADIRAAIAGRITPADAVHTITDRFRSVLAATDEGVQP